MKRMLLVFIFFVSPLFIFGQSNWKNEDRVEVRYVSLMDNCFEAIITRDDLVVYQHVRNQSRFSTPIYHTANQDTISLIMMCISDFWNSPPIVDTNDSIIDDMTPGLIISIHKGDSVSRHSYINKFTTFFPYSYTELLCILRELFAVHKIGNPRQ